MLLHLFHQPFICNMELVITDLPYKVVVKIRMYQWRHTMFMGKIPLPITVNSPHLTAEWTGDSHGEGIPLALPPNNQPSILHCYSWIQHSCLHLLPLQPGLVWLPCPWCRGQDDIAVIHHWTRLEHLHSDQVSLNNTNVLRGSTQLCILISDFSAVLGSPSSLLKNLFSVCAVPVCRFGYLQIGATCC